MLNKKHVMPEKQDDDPKLGFWSILLSTLAAAFGVQSEKNRERDFQHGNIWVFIAAGIIFTTVFVFSVIGIVKLVLADAL